MPDATSLHHWVWEVCNKYRLLRASEHSERSEYTVVLSLTFLSII